MRELTAKNPLVDLTRFQKPQLRRELRLVWAVRLRALCADHAAAFVSSVAARLYALLMPGLTVSPRGVGAFAALFFVGALVGRVDSRLLAGLGFAAVGLASFLLCRLSLQMTISNIVPAKHDRRFWHRLASSCR